MRSVFIVAVSIILTFPQGQHEFTMEYSVLTPGAQRDAGAPQGRQGWQGGEGAGGGTGWTGPWRFGVPLPMHNTLACQGARAGLQGQVGAQGARRDDSSGCSPCSHSPAAHGAHTGSNILLLQWHSRL